MVVTEKATRIIDTYRVDESGVADGPVSHPSNGVTPFGFSFNKRGVLIVSEAFGGTANASAVSSYALRKGALTLLSGSVPDFQSAVCWIVVTKKVNLPTGATPAAILFPVTALDETGR